MMKRSFLPRFIGFFFLYLGIFVILVMIQFTKQRGFTYKIGTMNVSGYYGDEEDENTPPNSGEYPLDGGANVFFGGMEFRLSGNSRGEELVLIRQDGEKEAAVPRYLQISDSAAAFRFAQGPELIFSLPGGGVPELLIAGVFGEEFSGVELPFRPMGSSRIRDSGSGAFIIGFEGLNYSFGSSPPDSRRRLLISEDATVSYRALPEPKNFVPEELVSPEAGDRQRYLETLSRWRDGIYNQWNGNSENLSDEDQVIAYVGEALRRGVYGSAVASIRPAFRGGNQRTYLSSVYFGRLDMGLRSIAGVEQERYANLSLLIREGSMDFLA
jgi:hypothetical protein